MGQMMLYGVHLATKALPRTSLLQKLGRACTRLPVSQAL
jgi:hypothetical protein